MTDKLKHALIAALGGLVLLLAGFIGGRLSGPASVVERSTHHETETKLATTTITQKVDIEEMIRLIQDQFAKLQKNVKVDRTVDKRPDGSEVIHTVTTDNSTSESGSHTDSSDEHHSTTATTATGTVLDQKLKIDDSFKSVGAGSASRWAAGAFATYQPLFSPPGFNLIPQKRVTVGVTLDYRLIGPLWIGGVLTSQAAIGIHLQLAR